MEEKRAWKKPPTTASRLCVESSVWCDFLFCFATHRIRNASKQKSFPFSHCGTLYCQLNDNNRKKCERNEINEMAYIQQEHCSTLFVIPCRSFSQRSSPSALAMAIFTIITIITISIVAVDESHPGRTSRPLYYILYRLESIDTQVRVADGRSSANQRTKLRNNQNETHVIFLFLLLRNSFLVRSKLILFSLPRA